MNKTIVSLAAAASVAAGSVAGVVLDGSAAASVAAGSVAGVVLDGSAGAATHTHTLKIKVHGLGEGRETRSGFVSQSKVTTLNNEFLGYEVDSGSFGPNGIKDRIAIALDGGILYLRTTVTEASEWGQVTGGAGRFAGAKGTIVSTSHDEEAQTATYTITWHK